MDTGIISLSFDDGRKDTYHVFMDILKPRNLPGVVYVPSGYIETNYINPLEIGHNGLMSKEQLDEVYSLDLFEIGAHGDFHKNDFEDIESGAQKLRQWYPGLKHLGFASPHSIISPDFVYKNIEKYKEIGFSYVRGGRNFHKFTKIKRGVSLIARITKSSNIFVQLYKGSLMNEKGYYLSTVSVHKLTSLEQVKSIVDYTVEKKLWGILEFHSIDKKGTIEYTEEFCWLEDDFVRLCDYLCTLRENKIIVIKNPIDIVR